MRQATELVRRRAARAAVAVAIGLLWPIACGWAQERYKLGNDDAWTMEEPPEPDTPEGQLARAKRLQARGDFVRAEEIATNWIDRNPNHALLHEAYMVRADALYGQTEHYKALFDYEVVIRGYPGTESFVIANQRELEIARLFAAGKRRKLWGLRIINASEEAEEIFIRVQERMPGSGLAEEAGMALGDFYFFRKRNMAMAADAYLLFVENYPNSAQISKARRRLIYAYLAAFKGPQFDVTGLYEAKARLRELQRVEPATAEQVGADALLSHIDEADARKLLVTARWYVRRRDYLSAEFTVRRLVARYPRAVATADALRWVPSIVARLPENVRSGLPDYEAMGRAVLGTPAAQPGDRSGPPHPPSAPAKAPSNRRSAAMPPPPEPIGPVAVP